jgi:CubicO group peptidase (beta-lactamase class C family)
MIRNIEKMVIFGVFLCCCACKGAPSERVDDYVQEHMKEYHVPGVSVAILKHGNVILSKGYGMANVELGVPATKDTVYQLASVTKQFTATGIMMLAEDGKLSLDDRITQHLSDLPTAWNAVTVRHLLSHTSGIKNYTSTQAYDKSVHDDLTHREMLDLVAKEPLEFKPGEKFAYSNTGYFLLGMLIEKITGKKYGEFLAERIFDRIGMKHTRVNDLTAIIPNRAHGYSFHDGILLNGDYVNPTQTFAAGALVSTATDLAKWDAALYTGRLLRLSSLEQMWTPAPLSGGETAKYGFGWRVDKVNGHRLISHGGAVRGFSTQISRFVDEGLTVIVLINADNGKADALATGIAQRILPTLGEQTSAK